MNDEERFKIWEKFLKSHKYGMEEWESYLCEEVEKQARASERKEIMAELEKMFGNYWGESYLMGQLHDFVMKKKKED